MFNCFLKKKVVSITLIKNNYREKLIGFLKRRSNPDGSFSMHEGGEADTRSCYCAAVVAKMTCVFPSVAYAFEKTAAWVSR